MGAHIGCLPVIGHLLRKKLPAPLFCVASPRLFSSSLQRSEQRLWSPEDLRRMWDYYHSGVSGKGIAAMLGRSYSAVIYQLHTPGAGARYHESPPKTTYRFWSQEEQRQMWEYYHTGMTMKQIAAILGRSFAGIRHKLHVSRDAARQQKPHPPRKNAKVWSQEEVCRLTEYIKADMPLKAIADNLGRPGVSVKSKINRLGLRRGHHFRKYDVPEQRSKYDSWTEGQVKMLKKCTEDKCTLNSLVTVFPKRSPAGIISKLKRLGLSYQRVRTARFDLGRWTSSEDMALSAYIQDRFKDPPRTGPTVATLASRLGRTPIAVTNRIRRLRERSMSAQNATKRWSAEDRLLLLQYASEGMRYKEIGSRLERSEVSIENQMRTVRGTIGESRKTPSP